MSVFDHFVELTLKGLIKSFLANVPILYPLKMPQSQRFLGVFRGQKMGTLARNGLKIRLHSEDFINETLRSLYNL